MLSCGGLFVAGRYVEYRADELRDIMRGRGNSEVESITVYLRAWDGERTVSDEASTRYLTAAFRRASEVKKLGTTYLAEVRLTSGTTEKCAIYVSHDQDRFAIAFPSNSFEISHDDYYDIPLSQPIPEPLAKVLLLMR
ncbi:MAG: hypothetical protein C0467_12865 [Planctomycetaceae bacterium]|nr:hypothetical protein [Planctomycetaceae bacterium]